jgi:hypothetical protein
MTKTDTKSTAATGGRCLRTAPRSSGLESPPELDAVVRRHPVQGRALNHLGYRCSSRNWS